jgi:hypothetical protein
LEGSDYYVLDKVSLPKENGLSLPVTAFKSIYVICLLARWTKPTKQKEHWTANYGYPSSCMYIFHLFYLVCFFVVTNKRQGKKGTSHHIISYHIISLPGCLLGKGCTAPIYIYQVAEHPQVVLPMADYDTFHNPASKPGGMVDDSNTLA